MSEHPPVTVDMDVDIRKSIASHRRDLAAMLTALPPGAWDTPSLCAGWRVREVVAHLTMPFRYSAGRFLLEVIRDGGRFNRMADRCARRDAATPADELVAVLRDNATSSWKPPGGGLEGALVHDVIHGLDITVALGAGPMVGEDRLAIVLEVVTRAKTLKHFGADLDGIELRADDLDWSFGSGRPVSGQAQHLALALCGRKLPAGLVRGGPSAWT